MYICIYVCMYIYMYVCMYTDSKPYMLNEYSLLDYKFI